MFPKAGYVSKLALTVEKNLDGETHRKRRRGYKLMFEFAPDKCRQLGFPEPGTFSKTNGHNGDCWGWKKECRMTNRKAGEILLELVNLQTMTMAQLGTVRKALAYSYQLMGNTVTKYQNNWPETYNVWKGVSDVRCAPTKSCKPTRIATPEEEKRAFTMRWSPATSKLSLIDWIRCRRAAYDTFFSGHRANKDMEKMKKSVSHKINAKEGWCWTAFFNGRCKLKGAKKNSRPWKQWAICWCKDGKHRSPTLRDRYNIDENGNPRDGKPGFDTLCITAGFEFTNLWSKKGKWRRYPALVGTGRGKSTKGNVGDSDVGEPKLLALRFMEDVGLPRYDTHSGRKAYAAMCAKLNIPWEWSFENHADTFATWEGSYQNGCRRERTEFKRRTQSTEIAVVTKALRTISWWMGLGSRRPTVQLRLVERQNDLLLRAMGLGTQANQLLMGLSAQLPSDFQVPRLGPPAVKPEKVEEVKPEPKKEED